MHEDHQHEPGTETEIPDSTVKYSHGFGSWTPTRPGECTAEDHNRYSGTNPEDDTVYHMWHPPVCPDSNCSFGHDHGMNPAESPLEQVFGPLYFGVPNERGMLSGIEMVHETINEAGQIVREEDNVGQKVLHGRRQFRDAKAVKLADGTYPASAFVSGDIRTLNHMGSSKPDAARNSIHGFTYQAKLDNGAMFNVSFFAAIGMPGGFSRRGDLKFIPMGPYSPANTPTRVNPLNVGGSFGDREIVESSGIEGVAKQTVSAQHFERWRPVVVVNSPVPTIKVSKYTGTTITNHNSAALQVNWYWSATYPARYFDGATQSMRYTIDTCKAKNPDGTFVAIGGPCVAHRALEKTLGREIKWNDPESFARGDVYGMRLTSFQIKNGPSATRPNVWYTDIEGRNPSLVPFANSVRWEGQPTEWWVNPFGEDARMVPYPGAMKVMVSPVTLNTMVQTDEPLEYAPVTATQRAKGINPNGTHAPN